jgi:hypothetical protein
MTAYTPQALVCASMSQERHMRDVGLGIIDPASPPMHLGFRI